MTHTTPAGNQRKPFDLIALVSGAGAQYAARYLVTEGPALVAAIKRAIETPGFSFVEAISPCPTQFGRQNKKDSIKDAYTYVESMVTARNEKSDGSSVDSEGLLVTGEYVHA
jgi:2-oxoglutarate ferredoxin oxidoreductase subunit beta